MKTTEQLRRALKSADELELPMDPQFYENLHNKIMAQVAHTEIEPVSPLMASKRLLMESWRSLVDPVGSSMD